MHNHVWIINTLAQKYRRNLTETCCRTHACWDNIHHSDKVMINLKHVVKTEEVSGGCVCEGVCVHIFIP